MAFPPSTALGRPACIKTRSELSRSPQSQPLSLTISLVEGTILCSSPIPGKRNLDKVVIRGMGTIRVGVNTSNNTTHKQLSRLNTVLLAYSFRAQQRRSEVLQMLRPKSRQVSGVCSQVILSATSRSRKLDFLLKQYLNDYSPPFLSISS